MMVAGKTQSGRPSVKSIIIAQGYDAGIPTVFLPKGVNEAREVTGRFRKLPDQISWTKWCVPAATLVKFEDQGQRRPSGRFRMEEHWLLPTAAQISKSIEVVTATNRIFNLVIDECDAM